MLQMYGYPAHLYFTMGLAVSHKQTSRCEHIVTNYIYPNTLKVFKVFQEETLLEAPGTKRHLFYDKEWLIIGFRPFYIS